jgi:hypothetical protein
MLPCPYLLGDGIDVVSRFYRCHDGIDDMGISAYNTSGSIVLYLFVGVGKLQFLSIFKADIDPIRRIHQQFFEIELKVFFTIDVLMAKLKMVSSYNLEKEVL